MHVSIIIPTFNERENVRTITERIRTALATLGAPYEIWFVDDSRDDTPQVLAGLSEAFAEVRFVHRTNGRGLGTAVVEGFRRSSGDLVIVMDADLQHPPELLPDIIQALETGAEVVIPSRFIAGGSDGGLSWMRKLISWTARSIGRLAVRRLRPVTDCTGGYFGVHRRVIEGVVLDPVGWKILMEVLVRGRYQIVRELPYVFLARDAGASKMNLREQWNYLRHVVRLVWSDEEDRRFYLFCFVGGLGTLVNLGAMGMLVYGFRLHAVVASVLASMLAMAHNFVWNDRVTWRGHAQRTRTRRTMQVPMFVLVSSVSVVVTALFEKAFLWAGWDKLLGQLLGIAVATVWSFVANNRWTWATASERA